MWPSSPSLLTEKSTKKCTKKCINLLGVLIKTRVNSNSQFGVNLTFFGSNLELKYQQQNLST
jgi:hypothetical protein